MRNRDNHIRFGQHARAFLTGAALIASAALLVVILLQVIDHAQHTTDESLYPLAGVTFALMWMISERLLKRSVYGVTLTTRWQDRLTFAIPAGFVASLIMLKDVAGSWAIASQLVGGWVIFCAAAVLVEVIWSGIKTMMSGGETSERTH